MTVGNLHLRKDDRVDGRLRPKSNKLSPKQVAAILEVHEETLRVWRRRKMGPPYYREVNRIYYYRDEFEAWRQNAKWG